MAREIMMLDGTKLWKALEHMVTSDEESVIKVVECIKNCCIGASSLLRGTDREYLCQDFDALSVDVWFYGSFAEEDKVVCMLDAIFEEFFDLCDFAGLRVGLAL